MTREQKLAEWKREEAEAAMKGWDFSHIKGRAVENELPWSYKQKVHDFLKPENMMLDMGTGGGEVLLSLGHPFKNTCVTEAWEPNVRLCEEKLAPLGITVRQLWDDKPLPYDDEQFDIVLNRQEYYNLDEVRRVLKPGGYFITQQVGSANGTALREFLCGKQNNDLSFNLENELPRFVKAGFSINYKNQCYLQDRFLDVGVVVWRAKVLPWEYPDFSVDKCAEKLFKLDELCEKAGYIPHIQHRFIIIARKKR